MAKKNENASTPPENSGGKLVGRKPKQDYVDAEDCPQVAVVVCDGQTIQAHDGEYFGPGSSITVPDREVDKLVERGVVKVVG